MSVVQDTYIVSRPHQRYSKSLGRRIAGIKTCLHLHCISCHIPTPVSHGREGALNASTAPSSHHGPPHRIRHRIASYPHPLTYLPYLPRLQRQYYQPPGRPPSAPASAHKHTDSPPPTQSLPSSTHPTPPRSTPTSHPPNLHPPTRNPTPLHASNRSTTHPFIPQHQSTSLSLRSSTPTRTQRTSSIHGQTTSDRGGRFLLSLASASGLAMGMEGWWGGVRWGEVG